MAIGKVFADMPPKQQSAAKYLAGFFALMILLTFASRAADSFTVPRVTAERISSGSLEHKAVAEGSLYPVSQIPVFAPPGYRILALRVEPGGRVAAGDVLAELDVSQIREQLDEAKAELEKQRLSASAAAVKSPEDADDSGVASAEKALERALADLETAERESQLRVEIASGEVYSARRSLRELRDMDADDMEIMAARDILRQRELALEEAELACEKDTQAAQRAIEDAEILLEQEKANADKAAETAAAENRRAALEREAADLDFSLAQKKVDELEAILETGGVVCAGAGGVVMNINGGVGSVTSGEGLFVLSDSSSGVVFRARVSGDELKRVKRGERVGIVLTGEGRAVEGVITGVSTTANEDGSFDVSAALPAGNWEPGTSGKMTVTQKTASYTVCVPNGAVRKDNDGHFVLVIREVKGVMGVRIVAERINVSVLERDGTKCAIESPLDKNDLIVTGGSRPVSVGDRVRLE